MCFLLGLKDSLQVLNRPHEPIFCSPHSQALSSCSSCGPYELLRIAAHLDSAPPIATALDRRIAELSVAALLAATSEPLPPAAAGSSSLDHTFSKLLDSPAAAAGLHKGDSGLPRATSASPSDISDVTVGMSVITWRGGEANQLTLVHGVHLGTGAHGEWERGHGVCDHGVCDRLCARAPSLHRPRCVCLPCCCIGAGRVGGGARLDH